MYRTKNDLEYIIKNSVVDQFLDVAKEAFATEQIANNGGYESYWVKYLEDYPVYIGKDDNGYVFPDAYYTTDSSGNRILKPEIDEYVKLGKVRPTLEKYMEDLTKQELEKASLDNPDFIEFIKPYFASLVQNLADNIHRKAEKILAQKQDLTQEQVDRYLAKYQTAKLAKEGDEQANELMEASAVLEGVDKDKLINLIIDLGDNWQNKLREFYVLIDSTRVGINRLFDVNPGKAIDLTIKTTKLGTDVTPDKLKELYNEIINS